MISGYHLYFFTEYSDNAPDLRYNVGWGSIGCLILLLIFNIVVMVFEIGSKTKFELKKKIF